MTSSSGGGARIHTQVWPVPFPPFSHKGTRGDHGRCVWLCSNGLALCGLHGAGWGIAAGPLCEDPLWVFARRPHPPLLSRSPPCYHPPQQTARIPTLQSTVGQRQCFVDLRARRAWLTAGAPPLLANDCVGTPTRRATAGPLPSAACPPPAADLRAASSWSNSGPSLPSRTAPQETEALLETLCPLHPSPQQP